jgi:hypothetical protein
MESVIVVGASLAGWRATEGLRAEGYDGKISLVGAEPHLPYDRPPLSKQILAGTWPPEKAVLADHKRASELLVHEVLGRRAVRLDADGRKVELDDGTVLSGDGIVVATGAAPRRLPGTESLGPADGLFVLRTLDDSLALRAAVTAAEGTRVVVIGAGFIGSEVASTCAGLDCRVTVVELMDIPLSNVLGPVVGGHCASLHGAHGVDLRTGVGIERVERGFEGARLVVHLEGGDTLDADVGAQPAGGARRSGGVHADPVLLVGPVRHPPPGAREPGRGRRGRDRPGLAGGREIPRALPARRPPARGDGDRHAAPTHGLPPPPRARGRLGRGAGAGPQLNVHRAEGDARSSGGRASCPGGVSVCRVRAAAHFRHLQCQKIAAFGSCEPRLEDSRVNRVTILSGFWLTVRRHPRCTRRWADPESQPISPVQRPVARRNRLQFSLVATPRDVAGEAARRRKTWPHRRFEV